MKRRSERSSFSYAGGPAARRLPYRDAAKFRQTEHLFEKVLVL